MAETNSNTPDQRIPPKLVIQPQGGAQPKPPEQAAPVAPKKQTTRIPLEAATPPAPGEMPKTIRLKPAAFAPTVKVPPPPTVVPTPPLSALTAAEAAAEKRKTSRISLEAALTPEAGEGPKTIRLKKPAEAGALKVSEAPKKQTTPIAKPAEEEPAAEAEPADATRRKTIRVKRPIGTRGIEMGAEIARPGEEPAAGGFAPAGEDRPHWFFLASAIAASLVACVLIYNLCAQAFGPNVSLTQLSYGAPSMDLPWPGKILPGGR